MKFQFAGETLRNTILRLNFKSRTNSTFTKKFHKINATQCTYLRHTSQPVPLRCTAIKRQIIIKNLNSLTTLRPTSLPTMFSHFMQIFFFKLRKAKLFLDLEGQYKLAKSEVRCLRNFFFRIWVALRMVAAVDDMSVLLKPHLPKCIKSFRLREEIICKKNTIAVVCGKTFLLALHRNT